MMNLNDALAIGGHITFDCPGPATLLAATTHVIDKDTHPYFRDVLDHAIRVNDSVDYLRELLNSALEVNLLLASVDQSEVTKKLASWAAILAVPTAVAGIYGMNFDFMPELRQRWGYPGVMGAMGLVTLIIYLWFRRRGWLRE